MSSTATSNYKLVKNIKTGSFDLKKLPSYSLCLQVGIRDFQLCVVNKQTNTCLVLEDYKLENIKTINTRLEAIQGIIANHSFASSDLWDNIKLTFKTHKFTLVPNSHFIPEASSDYLALNSEIKTKIEEVYYYKHISSDAVNIFAADKKVIAWAKGQYPNKSIQVIHQGSTLIEGILAYDDHSHEKAMYAYFDRGILHLTVCQQQKLLYYNQFAVRKSEDYLKYILLVFKEVGLSAKTSKLIVWGLIKTNAPQVELLKKYIRNISLGTKPNFLKFSEAFEDVADHRYFDLYSIFLCE
ncbi:DUF3822 family protein [Marinoscillum furvescens]|uniref:Uncharacterized protein DUF3822 n=1 Tax=Marinoscillum furvescens DSM 4134 TaxID=1122208 RepID=A0A3D9L179_MARFU|nr:DUF3822 family protein [Marinoscillum furvescens]RED97505.1 uncharacterized protein DUF3822 [Marinoscillum furvescens DSM 4134]